MWLCISRGPLLTLKMRLANLDVFFASEHIHARYVTSWDDHLRFQLPTKLGFLSIDISDQSQTKSQTTFRVLLDTRSSSSMFPSTEYVDAHRSTFNNVGRDLVIINPNALGAMQDHSYTVACSFP